MCLIVVAWRVHPRFPLVLASNRDEFHARPAAEAAVHPSAPGVIGGRDLEKGGSWLLAGARRLAAVTNVRDGRAPPEAAARSRGELVADFALGRGGAGEHLADLSGVAPEFGRFNLLAWDGESLHYAGNHPRFRRRELAAGVHGLSNGDLDAPWPKVERLRSAVGRWLDSAGPESAETDIEHLFAALADRRQADDHLLPDTGVGQDLERLLSSPFIVGERYGTRCSTVVLAGPEGLRLVERRFGPGGVELGRADLRVE